MTTALGHPLPSHAAPSHPVGPADSAPAKPDSLQFILEEVLALASCKLQRKVGIGALRIELISRDEPSLAQQVAALNKSRRSSAHPPVSLVDQVSLTLDKECCSTHTGDVSAVVSSAEEGKVRSDSDAVVSDVCAASNSPAEHFAICTVDGEQGCIVRREQPRCTFENGGRWCGWSADDMLRIFRSHIAS